MIHIICLFTDTIMHSKTFWGCFEDSPSTNQHKLDNPAKCMHFIFEGVVYIFINVTVAAAFVYRYITISSMLPFYHHITPPRMRCAANRGMGEAMSLPTAHPVSRPTRCVVLKEPIAQGVHGCQVRLGLALNFSVFLHEVLKDELQLSPHRVACKIWVDDGWWW